MLASVGWPDVAVAFIAGLPGIIAAIAAISVRREVHTPNGGTLGQHVEQAHKAVVETRGVVTRTLGQRKEDHPPGSHDTKSHTRLDDE